MNLISLVAYGLGYFGFLLRQWDMSNNLANIVGPGVADQMPQQAANAFDDEEVQERQLVKAFRANKMVIRALQLVALVAIGCLAFTCTAGQYYSIVNVALSILCLDAMRRNTSIMWNHPELKHCYWISCLQVCSMWTLAAICAAAAPTSGVICFQVAKAFCETVTAVFIVYTM